MALATDAPYDKSHMKSMVLPAALKALLPITLHARCEGVRCPRNARIFQTGSRPEWMYYVVSGEVTLERTGLQGEPVVLQRTRQGFVSEASLKSAKYHCDGLAVIDTAVVKIPIRDLSTALDRDPAFASRWIDMLNGEVRRLRLHCERLSMKSVKDRVLHLINTEGQNGAYTVTTGLKSLAGQLGVTHEALYRTLATLEKDQTLRRDSGVLSLLRGSPDNGIW
jgi:CRP/FNR family transcriptional regulator, dissimilatory nitrate respiration regulator